MSRMRIEIFFPLFLLSIILLILINVSIDVKCDLNFILVGRKCEEREFILQN